MTIFVKMKRKFSILFTIMAFILLSCNTKVEKENVPELIVASFEKSFPDKKDVEWGTKGETYEAKFMEDNKEVIIRFKLDGSYRVVDKNAEDDEDVETILFTLPVF